jgi:hypothetical protein
MSIYLGIDNGLAGGLVWLNISGEIIRKEVMPVRDNGKNRLVDARTLAKLLTAEPSVRVVAEIAAKFSPGKMALCSTWHSWGIVQATLELTQVRWEPVDAQRWQKIMLPGRKTGETKAAALETARRLWPSETFLATGRSCKPHDGWIDAALIAEYARRGNL